MENKEKLEMLYRRAIAAGLVKNKTDFAQKIDTTISVVSNCLKGVQKYNGTCATLATRAENFLLKSGVPVSGENIINNSFATDGSVSSVYGDVTLHSADTDILIAEVERLRKEVEELKAEKNKLFDLLMKK